VFRGTFDGIVNSDGIHRRVFQCAGLPAVATRIIGLRLRSKQRASGDEAASQIKNSLRQII
jgi:hypothetical protein